MVDRDRDLLVKRLEKDGQSRVLPAIAQAFPVEVHDELGDRRGATIVILDESCRTTLDFFQLVRVTRRVRVPRSRCVLEVWSN